MRALARGAVATYKIQCWKRKVNEVKCLLTCLTCLTWSQTKSNVKSEPVEIQVQCLTVDLDLLKLTSPSHFIVSDLGTLGMESCTCKSCTCNKQMLKQQMNKWSFRKAGGSNKVWAIPLYWIRESEQMDAGRLVQSLGDPALHSLRRKWTNGCWKTNHC